MLSELSKSNVWWFNKVFFGKICAYQSIKINYYSSKLISYGVWDSEIFIDFNNRLANYIMNPYLRILENIINKSTKKLANLIKQKIYNYYYFFIIKYIIRC